MKVPIVNEVNKVADIFSFILFILRPEFNSIFTMCSMCSLFGYIVKDFVIEALRSIAELITYGDQHDASFFECEP